ncbi:hypothetical protein NHG22_02265 [Streptomyces sp. ATE26]|uniref:hypothetical protein n=1 Tax=Streptomyces sp. ATE26 TaxID=2954237 RepID=UPI002482B725|nr:hypothetical protein [Streptomyces sp. ATE26]MDI1452657.1 hypothetical protein [Streptomyces sp. ATE26]
MRSSSHVTFGILLLVAAVTVVGCSSETHGQEFTVPKALCGVSVPAGALAQLLPESGERLTVERRGSLDDGSALCGVKVDEDTVLQVSGERVNAGDSARHILRSRLLVQEQKSANGNSIAYVDQAAVSVIQCRGADVEEEDVSTFVKVLRPARPNESAMKDLIQGYTASLKKQQVCKRAS